MLSFGFKTEIYKYTYGHEDKVKGYEPQCLNYLIRFRFKI